MRKIRKLLPLSHPAKITRTMWFNYFDFINPCRSGIGEVTQCLKLLMPVQTARNFWNYPENRGVGGRGGGGGWAGASALTRFVLLAPGGDGERMHVQPQVPGHGVQQQHREGPGRVGVVEQGAQLPALQPVAAHIPLGVQEGRRGGLCSEKSQQLTTPLKKRSGSHSPNPLPRPGSESQSQEGEGERLCQNWETCILEPSLSSLTHSNDNRITVIY